MNKLKRLIALIISILMLTMTTSFAVYEDVNNESQVGEAISFFEDLGLVTGYEDGLFRPEQGMMRADFAIMMAGLLGYDSSQAYSVQHFDDVPESNTAHGSIEFLYEKGLVRGTENGLFEPDTPIMYAHAVKMVMSALGYDYYSELNGGYPNGYYAAASYAGLPSSAGTTTLITRGEACVLMFKAMSAPMMGYSGDGMQYLQDKNKTLMNTTLKITKYEGMFVANEDLSIYGEYVIEPGYIVLDYKRYTTELTNLTGRVGHYVKYYLNEDDEVIAIYDTAEDTLTVSGDDLQSSSTKNIIYYTDGNKSKYYNIAEDAYYVYNGAPCPNITDDYFRDIYGSVNLVMNDDDKYADTVIIWDYTDYLVSSYSAYANKLYVTNPSREFDLTQKDYVIKKNGEVIEPSALVKNDVLTVAENDNSIVFNVSNTVVTGAIQAEDSTNGEFTISGTTYKKADGCLESFDFGISYDVYLDFLGNVFYFEKASTENVAYVYNSFCGSPQADLNEVYSKVFTEKEDFLTLQYADNVVVYSGYEKTSYKPSELLSKFLRDENDEAIEQLIKYELNNDGKIAKVKIPKDVAWEEDWGVDYFKCNMDTAVAKANYDAANGQVPSLKNEQANMYNNLLSWVNGEIEDRQYAARMASDSMVFTISKHEKDWTVRAATTYPNGQDFKNAKIYDITKTGAVGYMLVKSDSEEAASSTYSYTDPIILVTSRITVLNDDEEACPALVGIDSDGEKQTYYSKEANIETDSQITHYPDAMLADVEAGDVVQLKVDTSNNITGFRILCRSEETPEFYFTAFPTNQSSANFVFPPVSHSTLFHGPTEYVDGTYIYKNSDEAISDYDNGVQTKYPILRFKHSATKGAILYDKSTNTAEWVESESGFASDNAFIYTYPGYGRMMIVLYQ